ncbi:hypothetical protein LINGRAHAP2_LOCUS12418 [Linum grandiflorum]
MWFCAAVLPVIFMCISMLKR